MLGLVEQKARNFWTCVLGIFDFVEQFGKAYHLGDHILPIITHIQCFYVPMF